MKKLVSACLGPALAFSLNGCATLQPTEQAALEYNRAFARARDNTTLLNILRASERHPLQFSTISNVTGALRTGIKLSVPFTNVIAGGKDVISPGFEFSNRNPNVSIQPLGTKEFIQGLSRPISVTAIDQLIAQGWPRPLVLQLVIAGVECKDGKVYANNGDDWSLDKDFYDSVVKSESFTLADEPEEIPPYRVLTMPIKEAVDTLRNGVGDGFKVKLVDASEPSAVVLHVSKTREKVIKGLTMNYVCEIPKSSNHRGLHREHTVTIRPDSSEATALGDGEKIWTRSVLQAFMYLGRVHKSEDAGEHEIIRLEAAGNTIGAPVPALASVEFLGRVYYVPVSSSDKQRQKTIEALSLLTYLVDAETSEAFLKSPIPVVTLAQ